jgi:hypothetical protein
MRASGTGGAGVERYGEDKELTMRRMISDGIRTATNDLNDSEQE